MPSSAKTELRRRLRAELARMSPAACATASESIRTSIPTLPRWQAVRVVAAYAALPDEPDLQPFDWTPERTLILPRMDGENLAFHEIRSPADLVPARFGVLEPDPDKCPPADPACAGVIFVPGAAFTADGDRLGRGRGYYDRLLAALPSSVLRVGVCFRGQLVETLPLEAHDQGVDIVLTSPD
ncbi:MAG: 5-formyltetrahydrofolate cyclo-ligase [Chthoniobacterales bacterium]|nr:5-formyltetrahydrofolate cyclo-ligase [Chthoniobacterales bacterium]